ncbi:InlB B-repeat-containing protein [Treponema zioleckii]|uniref:InlB B-repeat-containing protein n=1 Tax=Treponema zioleckii TaxID=331680 RepID=UPI00168BCD28|nr:InlB B-repeat-containing protein [Treponema zioleckii]
MKKLALFLLLLALFVFTSCSSDSESEPEKIFYTVTFNSAGGSEVASQTVESGTLATRPEAPSRTGYTFSAWLCGDADFDFNSKITADTTLTAKWTANTYTVTLDNNGETTEILATYGEKLPDLEEVPALANSNFGGFYTEKYAKGTKFIDSEGEGCKIWELVEDATLYAAWGYKISYENIKDVENPNPEIYTGEDYVTLTDLKNIVGFVFLGWYDAETGGNKVESIAAGSTGTKTLYARWQEYSYTVKHLLQNIENDEYTLDTEEKFYLNPNETTSAAAKTIEGFDAQPFEQKTLTADNSIAVIEIKYNRKTYNVEFDAKGGSEVTTQTVRYGAKATAPTSERTPYDLIGWYTSNDGGETLAENSFDFTTPIAASVKLYAKWYLDLSNCTADNVVEKINAMTESDTVIFTGEISYSTINAIGTAINKKSFGIGLDLSGTTGLTEIYSCAFWNCKGLTSVSIPASVTSIKYDAFNNCTGLTSVTIPAGVTSIETRAFADCTGLTSITIPASVISIGNTAFADCNKLANITFEGTAIQWNAIEKGDDWHSEVPRTTKVSCSDRDVAL